MSAVGDYSLVDYACYGRAHCKRTT